MLPRPRETPGFVRTQGSTPDAWGHLGGYAPHWVRWNPRPHTTSRSHSGVDIGQDAATAAPWPAGASADGLVYGAGPIVSRCSLQAGQRSAPGRGVQARVQHATLRLHLSYKNLSREGGASPFLRLPQSPGRRALPGERPGPGAGQPDETYGNSGVIPYPLQVHPRVSAAGRNLAAGASAYRTGIDSACCCTRARRTPMMRSRFTEKLDFRNRTLSALCCSPG